MCALLNGLGLMMIHRIDLAQRAHLGSNASANAPQQLLWTLMALLVFAAVLIIVRDHRPWPATAIPLAWWASS